MHDDLDLVLAPPVEADDPAPAEVAPVEHSIAPMEADAPSLESGEYPEALSVDVDVLPHPEIETTSPEVPAYMQFSESPEAEDRSFSSDKYPEAEDRSFSSDKYPEKPDDSVMENAYAEIEQPQQQHEAYPDPPNISPKEESLQMSHAETITPPPMLNETEQYERGRIQYPDPLEDDYAKPAEAPIPSSPNTMPPIQSTMKVDVNITDNGSVEAAGEKVKDELAKFSEEVDGKIRDFIEYELIRLKSRGLC